LRHSNGKMRSPPVAVTVIWSIVFLLGLILRRARGAFSIDELRHGFYDLDILSEPILHPLRVDADENEADVTVDEKASHTSPETPENRDDFVIISNLGGQEYYCNIPKFSRPASNDELLKQQRNWTTENITSRLDPLKSRLSCLQKMIGWWTYEFCYGTDIRQYHVENGKIVGNQIYLGYFDTDYDWAKASDAQRATQRLRSAFFHSQNYTRGSLCELRNRMRNAEVRYFCDADADGSYIARIDEPESCQYLVTIHTPLLCDLPGFLSDAPEHRPPAGIECRPALPKREFDAYHAELEQRKGRHKQQFEAKEKLEKQQELQSREGERKTIQQRQRSSRLLENYVAEFQDMFESTVKREFAKYGIDVDSMQMMTLNVGANGPGAYGAYGWGDEGDSDEEDETYYGSEKDRFFDVLDEMELESKRKKTNENGKRKNWRKFCES